MPDSYSTIRYKIQMGYIWVNRYDHADNTKCILFSPVQVQLLYQYYITNALYLVPSYKYKVQKWDFNDDDHHE